MGAERGSLGESWALDPDKPWCVALQHSMTRTVRASLWFWEGLSACR